MAKEIHVRPAPEIVKKVEALAKKERRSLTQQCVVLIEEALIARTKQEAV